MNILTVDDDPVIRRTLAEILKTEPDWQIIDADDGEVAWQMLDNGLEADMCILDNVMPRLTGIELLKRMRADSRFEKTPVMLLTLNRDRGLVIEAIQQKVSAFILKPFDATRVIKQVKEVASKIPKRSSGNNEILSDPEQVIDRLKIDYSRYLVMLDIFIEDLNSGIKDIRTCIQGSDVLAAFSRLDSMKGACVTLGANRFRNAADKINQMGDESTARLEDALNELRRKRDEIASNIHEKGLTGDTDNISTAGADGGGAVHDRAEVMLVEDKPAIVRQIKENLTSNDWRFTHVESSREVTSYVMQASPSLIIISLSLPDEGAFEIIRFLRANAKTRKVPVFGLSIKTATHEHRKAEEAGFTAIITKPLDFGDLRKRIMKILNIEASTGAIKIEGETVMIDIPEKIEEALLDEISSEFSKTMSEAIDNGCGKVVVNASICNEPSANLFKFFIDALKDSEESSLSIGYILNEALEKECKNYSELEEITIYPSLAEATA